jgi:hypothetical protein
MVFLILAEKEKGNISIVPGSI